MGFKNLVATVLQAGNASGRVRIDSSGIKIFDATGNLSIQITPGSQPTLTFFSPDGTNIAFLNLITGAGGQAQLGINSGKFTPADGIRRYWRLFAADDNATAQVVRESTQLTLGAAMQMSHLGPTLGFRDVAGGLFTLLQIGDGTADFFQDDGSPIALKNANLMVPCGALVNRKSTLAQVANAGETIDTGIGSGLPGNSANTSFLAFTGRTYRVSYRARGLGTTVPVTMDIRIRDGFDGTGAPPAPTAASTPLTGDSAQIQTAGGTGGTGMHAFQTLDCPGDIAPGLHRLGCFYARTAGGSTVNVDQSGGSFRELTVDDVGSTA